MTTYVKMVTMTSVPDRVEIWIGPHQFPLGNNEGLFFVHNSFAYEGELSRTDLQFLQLAGRVLYGKSTLLDKIRYVAQTLEALMLELVRDSRPRSPDLRQ